MAVALVAGALDAGETFFGGTGCVGVSSALVGGLTGSSTDCFLLFSASLPCDTSAFSFCKSLII